MSSAEKFISTEHQHIRFNPLNGQWILVSPHRMLRPWSGQEEKPEKNNIKEFDASNPLCPGVTRPNGQINPLYKSTFVFTNDYPALLEDVPAPPPSEDPLFQACLARGTCRVMCFDPKSNKTLPTMTTEEITWVIYEWIKEFRELQTRYTWVQIFENKGLAMGCSNPHPHCQIWCSSYFPSDPQLKDCRLREYYINNYCTPLLDDYVKKELIRKERIVIQNRDWLVVVPYWATWPFETMLISRNCNKRIDDLTKSQIENLAITIKKLTTKYDNLFQCSFPYSMGWHGAPTGDFLKEDNCHWTLHAIYYPPLLRSSSVRKFMVGYELLCQAQRDLTPEQAAKRLRECNEEIHYLDEIQTNLSLHSNIQKDIIVPVNSEASISTPAPAPVQVVGPSTEAIPIPSTHSISITSAQAAPSAEVVIPPTPAVPSATEIAILPESEAVIQEPVAENA